MSILGPDFTANDTSSSLGGGKIPASKSMNMDTGSPDDESDSVLNQPDVTYDEVVSEIGTTPEEMAIAAQLTAIVPIIKARRDRAKRARQAVTEPKWIKAYYSWRGEYNPEEKKRIAETQARNPGSSEIFIKITKTKVQAAYGQILDILLSNNKIPLEVKPSPKPEGIADQAFIAEPSIADIYGHPGDDKEIKPGDTAQTLLGGLYEKYQSFVKGKSLIEGPSPDSKKFIEIDPADEAAKNMQKMILDQLEQGDFQEQLRKVAFECVLLGTGFLKGPMTYTQTIHNWEKDEQTGTTTYKPKSEDIPQLNFTSAWNLYPDPDASDIQDCEYVVERHLLHRHELKGLGSQPGFDKNAIARVLRRQAKYEREYWETIIQDSANYTLEEERYEVLEYWGYLEKELLLNLDGLIDKDDLAKYLDTAQVNIWVCGDEVIRITLNPFTPIRIPYFAVPFEEHPYQIWGIGVPENMEDTQLLMNGHMRMGIDNLRLSGNVILEVNEAQLVPGQEMALYPGKIFRKQGGAPGQSIYPININNTTQQHMMMFDKARQLADEATGMPSYAQGQTGVTGTTRTAAGMSMLMGAAGLNTKTVIRNFDHYLLRPVGEAIFAWNMQFNDDHPEIRGDLQIVANGTAALMQKEVQSQRLLSLLQLTSNQLVAPFVNVTYIIKQIASSMDLDPDKAINDPQAAALMASIMSQMNQQGQGGGQPPQPGQPQQPGQGQQGQPNTGGINPSDPTGAGGGNIGVGQAPQPGQKGFAGNGPQQPAMQ